MDIHIPESILTLHADAYGAMQGFQLRHKAVEECAELIVAIRHFDDGKDTLDHVIEECGDVIICAAFLLRHLRSEAAQPYSIGDDPAIAEKLDRLAARLLEMVDDKNA